MAAADVSAMAVEIAGSLTIEEIPVKLRCAGCNKLALNAIRMPCCDQSLCETCQDSLESYCPVCLHEYPENVKKEDCKPNKTLRTTIKAFLRKKGMEREAARKKEEKLANLPPPSATSKIAETMNGTLIPPNPEAVEASNQNHTNMKDNPQETPQAPTMHQAQVSEQGSQQTFTDAQMDVPRPSIEIGNETNQEGLDGQSQATSGNKEDDGKHQVQNGAGLEQQSQNAGVQDQTGLWPTNGGVGQGMPDVSFAFDGTRNGFANMGFPGTTDFSQMMQMMPSTMPSAMMSTFPNMMGMPGMGMDPMAMSQAMYGGFGGPGMGMSGMHGMNGMNMGMGMNAMNAGQGAFGGFNGQPDAWNTGQDNFNPNAYGGHANGMGGDFGPHSGYGGYNMPSHRGNFNQMNHQQFPHNDTQNGFNGQGFPNRGRGRRGGYNNNGRGRGSYNQVTQGNYGNHANYEPFHHQLPTHVAQQNPQQASKSEQQQDRNPDEQTQAYQGSQHDPVPGATATDQEMQDQIKKELNPGDEDDESQTDKVVLPTSGDTNSVAESSKVRTDPEKEKEKEKEKEAASPSKQSEETRKIEEPKLAPIQTYISNEDDRPHKPSSANLAKVEPAAMPPPFPAIPLGPAALYSQDHSFDSSGRGRGSSRGYYRGSSEFRGGFRGRGAGYVPNSNGIHCSPMQAPPTTTLPPTTPAEPKGLGVEGAPKGPKALREGLPNTSVRGGRGFSIVGRASAAAHAQPNGIRRSRSPSPSRRRSRSRTPSTSQRRSSHHRSHRHRSHSESEEAENERRKERHRRRSRKYEEEDKNGRPDGIEEPRKRDLSPEPTSKRSSHRSHRNHEKETASGSNRHHRERSRDRDDERRQRRKRSRSPVTTSTAPTPTNIEPPPLSPSATRRLEKEDSRKRRDRDDDEHPPHLDRKRSRRERSATPENKDHNRSTNRPKRKEGPEESTSNHTNSQNHTNPLSHSTSRSTTAADPPPTKPSTAAATAPKQSEKDHHTLEREARNHERLMKELQRREANEGKGPKRKVAVNGVVGSTGGVSGGARRVSYKYEDEVEEEVRVGRGESEREAGRWG